MSGPEIRKLYYSTQEICRLLHIRAYDLKQWEKKFSALKPSVSKTGRRLYKSKDLEIVRHIHALITQGHSDDEINFILNHPDSTLLIKKRTESELSPQGILEELEDILRILQPGHRISGSAVQSSFDKPLS
jgi:DNA-binding transcriptional MerR regulator